MLSREHQIILEFLLELTREEQYCSSQFSINQVVIPSEDLEIINDFFNEMSMLTN